MATTAKSFVDGLLLTASAATYYTVPSTVSTTAIIQALTVLNNDTVARTVTIYLIPTGVAASNGFKVLSAKTLAPGQELVVYTALGKVMPSGGLIQALASSAGVVALQASGVEIT